jgi:hypothetical protein
MEYRRIASTRWYGIWVSTVWLGLDHSFGGGPPLIFESMVFDPGRGEGRWHDVDMDRYTTEAQARAGHRTMVEKTFGRQRSAHRVAVGLTVLAVVLAYALLAQATGGWT